MIVSGVCGEAGVQGGTYLWFEVLDRVSIHAKLSSPFQGGFEPFYSFPDVPFCGSEVP